MGKSPIVINQSTNPRHFLVTLATMLGSNLAPLKHSESWACFLGSKNSGFLFIIYSFYLYQYLRVGGWFQLSTHLQKYAQLSNLDHETPRIGVTKTKYLSCHHLEWAWYGYTSIYQPPNLTRHIDMSKWRLRHSIVKPSLPELHGTSFFWKLPSFGNLPQKSFKRSSINKTLENKHLIIPSGLYHLNPH